MLSGEIKYGFSIIFVKIAEVTITRYHKNTFLEKSEKECQVSLPIKILCQTILF